MQSSLRLLVSLVLASPLAGALEVAAPYRVAAAVRHGEATAHEQQSGHGSAHRVMRTVASPAASHGERSEAVGPVVHRFSHSKTSENSAAMRAGRSQAAVASKASGSTSSGADAPRRHVYFRGDRGTADKVTRVSRSRALTASNAKQEPNLVNAKTEAQSSIVAAVNKASQTAEGRSQVRAWIKQQERRARALNSDTPSDTNSDTKSDNFQPSLSGGFAPKKSQDHDSDDSFAMPTEQDPMVAPIGLIMRGGSVHRSALPDLDKVE